MDKLGRLEVEQLKVTSTTPPADSGFYKIDETTMGVVGDLKFRHPKTGAMSSALAVTSTSAQGVVNITLPGETLGDMLPGPRCGSAANKFVMDPGFDTGWVRDGAFENLAGSGQGWAITYGKDADGPYVQASIATAGVSKILAASFPAPVDFSTLKSGFDLVVDIDWPGDVGADDFDIAFSLSQSANFVNSGSRVMQWYNGGTRGAIKRGRNILFSRTELGTTGYAWSVSGTYDPANPVTYAGIRIAGNPSSLGGLGSQPPAGFTMKIRELRARCFNVAGVILGFDDAHITSEPLYRYALSRGIKICIPVCMNFVRSISNYMRVDALLELQDLGAEILNHTFNHSDMRYFSYEQALDAIGTNKEQMAAAGFKFVPVFVYPGGHYNDAVIQAARDLGYVIARSAGVPALRVHPVFGLANPMRLSSLDFGGQTLDSILSSVDRMTTQQAHYICWLYAHRSQPGNPASSSAAPADTLYWPDGWYRQVIDKLAQYQSSSQIRSLLPSDLVGALVSI